MITLTKVIAGIWEYSETTKINQNDLLILSTFDHKESYPDVNIDCNYFSA